MKVQVYYDPITKGFYQTDINLNIPSTAIEISDKERWDLISAVSSGKKIAVQDNKILLVDYRPNEEEMCAAERLWRNAELLRADIELNKVQDSDSKSKGTVAQWRDYRKSLRAWPESSDFPDKLFRPKSPDQKE